MGPTSSDMSPQLHTVGAFFVYCALGWTAFCGNGPKYAG